MTRDLTQKQFDAALPAYSVHGPVDRPKGMHIMDCPSATIYKTRAARLIGDGLKCRWSRQAGGYVVSPSKLRRFEKMYAEGWDASYYSGDLLPPEAYPTPLVVNGRIFGSIWGGDGPSFQTCLGDDLWMWRKGQRVRFANAQGEQIGPEQPNVAPAMCAAFAMGWRDPSAPQWLNDGCAREMGYEPQAAGMEVAV